MLLAVYTSSKSNLEKADNDISRLLQVVSEASNASVSGSSKVATKENPHNTDDLNVLLSAIADNEQPFYLFLDNFDVITEPSTLSILSDALNHLKSHQQIDLLKPPLLILEEYYHYINHYQFHQL